MAFEPTQQLSRITTEQHHSPATSELRPAKSEERMQRLILIDDNANDLQVTRGVQEALVPPSLFGAPRIEIRSAYIPSEPLSGDFYDYFVLDGQLYLFVADVSGHGLPAAILVSLLKSYIHTKVDGKTPLGDLMARLNDFLFSVSLPTQFATAQLFRIDTNGNVTYANAAHPSFLHFRHSEGRTTMHEQPSHLLGAMPGMLFDDQ